MRKIQAKVSTQNTSNQNQHDHMDCFFTPVCCKYYIKWFWMNFVWSNWRVINRRVELSCDSRFLKLIKSRLMSKSLKSSKSTGANYIAAEMLKHEWNPVVQTMTRLLNSCWEEQCVPDDWRNGVIVKLPKIGALTDWNNQRGTTLLSAPGKFLSIVLLE